MKKGFRGTFGTAFIKRRALLQGLERALPEGGFEPFVGKYLTCYDSEQDFWFQPVNGNPETAGNQLAIASNQLAIAGNQALTEGNQSLTAGNQSLIAGNQALPESNQSSIASNQVATAGNQVATAGNFSYI